MNQFMESRDVKGNNILSAIRRDQRNKLISGTFDIGMARKVRDGCLNRATTKNITRLVCIINVVIPFTAWPVTNPIIIKISKNISKKKFIQIKNKIIIRLNLQ